MDADNKQTLSNKVNQLWDQAKRQQKQIQKIMELTQMLADILQELLATKQTTPAVAIERNRIAPLTILQNVLQQQTSLLERQVWQQMQLSQLQEQCSNQNKRKQPVEERYKSPPKRRHTIHERYHKEKIVPAKEVCKCWPAKICRCRRLRAKSPY